MVPLTFIKISLIIQLQCLHKLEISDCLEEGHLFLHEPQQLLSDIFAIDHGQLLHPQQNIPINNNTENKCIYPHLCILDVYRSDRRGSK